MTKATHKKTTIDIIKQHKKAEKKQAGQGRQMASGVSAASAGTQSLVQSSQSSSAGNNSSGALLTAGGTMIGPIAFYPRAVMISSDTIDISSTTDTGFSSRVTITGQTTADDLKQIDGASNAGQILFLQSITGQTITLKHHTGSAGGGNINIPGGADHVMGAQDIVLLQWDTINAAYTNSGGQWTLVSSSGSGFQNPATADLNMNSWDVNNVDALRFDSTQAGDNLGASDVGIVGNSAGMVFNVASSDTYSWSIDDDSKLSLSSTIFSSDNVDIVGINGATLGTSVLPWVNGYITDITLGGGDSGLSSIGKIAFANNSGNPSGYSNGTVYYNGTDLYMKHSGGQGRIALLTPDLDMDADNIEDLDVLKFSQASGETTSASDSLISCSPSGMQLNVPTGDTFTFTVQDDNILQIYGTSTGISASANIVDYNGSYDLGTSSFPWQNVYSDKLRLINTSSNPTTNGQFTLNGTDVKVYTGGGVKSLSDIGSGGGGSGANTSLSNLNSTGESHFVKLSNTGSWTAIQRFNAGIDMQGEEIDDCGDIDFDSSGADINFSTSGYIRTSGTTHFYFSSQTYAYRDLDMQNHTAIQMRDGDINFNGSGLPDWRGSNYTTTNVSTPSTASGKLKVRANGSTKYVYYYDS